MSVTLDDSTEGQLTGSELLGDDTHRWESSDGRHQITFGRPRGLVSIKVARILGPQQAANPVLDAYYKAVASIRTWTCDNVEQEFMEPSTELQFEFAFNRLGDDALNQFTISWQMSLYPEAMKAMKDAIDAGESPEALARISQQAGVQHSKKSRSRSSSDKP